MVLRMLLYIYGVLQLLPCYNAKGKDWSYIGKYGVDNWPLYFPTSKGTCQSPVNLSPAMITKDSKLTPFIFSNFDNTHDISWLLQNNGHSALVSFPSGDLGVRGGGLAFDYTLEQFHFHWGSDDTKGSEHTIDGVPYPLEMHLVTYKRDYGNFTNALQYKDGLAVFGVFFEMSKRTNPYFENLVDALSQVKERDSQCQVAPVPLRTMLPVNSDHFYRYQGSLTTPPFSEVVTWSLFKEPVRISTEQLAEFRKLESVDDDKIGITGLPLVDNFRPTQELNGRMIKCNF